MYAIRSYYGSGVEPGLNVGPLLDGELLPWPMGKGGERMEEAVLAGTRQTVDVHAPVPLQRHQPHLEVLIQRRRPILGEPELPGESEAGGRRHVGVDRELDPHQVHGEVLGGRRMTPLNAGRVALGE